MLQDIIGRAVAACVVALMLPVIFVVFVLICIITIVRTLFEVYE